MTAGKYGEPWGTIAVETGPPPAHRGIYVVDSGGACLTWTLEHASRIVACVNACEGIPTERLALVVGRGRSAEVGGWRARAEGKSDMLYVGTVTAACWNFLEALGYKIEPVPSLEMPGGERDEKIEPRKEAPDEVVE